MMRPGMNKYLLLAMSLFIAGCYEQKPPKGFEAVIPVQQNQMRQGCPNLIDTYLITSAQEHNALLLKEPIDGKDFSYLVIDSLTGDDRTYNYRLRMDRDQFIRKAQDLKDSSREKYALWRESTLLINKNYSEELLNKILQYGAVYERKGQLHASGCADGWVKIQEVVVSLWDIKTETNYIRQDDVWLARDQYGDLLIHTISYKQKPGWTFWAAGGAGMNLVRMFDQWTKIRKASDANLTTALTEADLPIARKVIHKISQCKLPNEIFNFSERLTQNGLMIEQFSIKPIVIVDGACVQAPLQLGFSSATSAHGETIMQTLKNDPIVNNIDILETRYDNGQLRYLVQVSFKDLDNPE